MTPVTKSLFQNAKYDVGERIGGTIVQATAGGLASVAGGGKFANGAVTAAFQYNVALGPGGDRTMAAYAGPGPGHNGGPPLDDPNTIRIPIPPGIAALMIIAEFFRDALQIPQGVDRYKSILDDDHLTAALRELNGEVVARKWDGTPYDHVTEVREAQQGLLNYITTVNNRLGNPDISQFERDVLQTELGNASRLLDYSRKFVPR